VGGNDVVEVAGYRVALHAREGPIGTGWVATMGAVVPAEGAADSPLTLYDIAAWRLVLRGYGASRVEAQADLAAELAKEADRMLARCCADR
jgi:hypothetical protein